MEYDLISVEMNSASNKSQPVKLVEEGNVMVPLVEAVDFSCVSL